MSNGDGSTPAARNQDRRWMEQALGLAREAVGLASPNPTVGCVLVRNGAEIGRGAHHYDARDHAEIVALQQAGEERARGATAYVTLEPCSHTGRTGPCAEALLRAGVARVVVATTDPNPQVAGRGLARLRGAGVEIVTGVGTHEARRLNDPFARHIVSGLPFVTLKAGVSLDGRIAPRSRERAAPVYLTSPASLERVQAMRHGVDAVLTGIGTVLSDDPLLTDRSGAKRRRPLLRVVLDSQLRLAPTARLLAEEAETVLVLTGNARGAAADALRARGAEVAEVALGEHGRVDLLAGLRVLGARGVLAVLLECGGELNSAFLRAGLVDRLSLFYAPRLLGEQGVPLLAGAAPLQLAPVETAAAASGGDIHAEYLLRDPWLGVAEQT